MLPIAISRQQITQFCEKHHIRKLSLFGSVLSEHFNKDSDVDVLVEFDPAHIPGWEFITIQNELSAIIGRSVDLNTAGFLSDTFRDEVLAQAIVVYEQV